MRHQRAACPGLVTTAWPPATAALARSRVATRCARLHVVSARAAISARAGTQLEQQQRQRSPPRLGAPGDRADDGEPVLSTHGGLHPTRLEQLHSFAIASSATCSVSSSRCASVPLGPGLLRPEKRRFSCAAASVIAARGFWAHRPHAARACRRAVLLHPDLRHHRRGVRAGECAGENAGPRCSSAFTASSFLCPGRRDFSCGRWPCWRSDERGVAISISSFAPERPTRSGLDDHAVGPLSLLPPCGSGRCGGSPGCGSRVRLPVTGAHVLTRALVQRPSLRLRSASCRCCCAARLAAVRRSGRRWTVVGAAIIFGPRLLAQRERGCRGRGHRP